MQLRGAASVACEVAAAGVGTLVLPGWGTWLGLMAGSLALSLYDPFAF